MYKAKELFITVDKDTSVAINSMAYAASKLWNVGNYEKKNYDSIPELSNFPDWYNQKKRLKDNFWYKNLPSQTAQDVLQRLQEGWKSYFKLLKNNKVVNPKPPKYKQEPIAFTYLNNGFRAGKGFLRLAIPKAQKQYLSSIGINKDYLYLETDKHFPKTDTVKEITVYPSNKTTHKIIVVYKIADVKPLQDNGKYLSIDLGVNNVMTCYDNSGKSFIVGGNKFIELTHYYYKKIAHYQSINAAQQSAKGVKYPKISKRVKSIYDKKNRAIKNLLHQTTTYIIKYCVKNDIHTLVVGNLKNIRKDKDAGIANQKLHSYPFNKIYMLLEYKAKEHGIRFIKQNEAYSSQCNPGETVVSKDNCTGERVHRGLYVTDSAVYNADSVGAYNILRLYKQKSGINILTPLVGLSNPTKIYPCN